MSYFCPVAQLYDKVSKKGRDKGWVVDKNTVNIGINIRGTKNTVGNEDEIHIWIYECEYEGGREKKNLYKNQVDCVALLEGIRRVPTIYHA